MTHCIYGCACGWIVKLRFRDKYRTQYKVLYIYIYVLFALFCRCSDWLVTAGDDHTARVFSLKDTITLQQQQQPVTNL